MYVPFQTKFLLVKIPHLTNGGYWRTWRDLHISELFFLLTRCHPASPYLLRFFGPLTSSKYDEGMSKIFGCVDLNDSK